MFGLRLYAISFHAAQLLVEHSYFSAKRACDSCFNVATHSETRLKLAQEEMEKMPEVEV